MTAVKALVLLVIVVVLILGACVGSLGADELPAPGTDVRDWRSVDDEGSRADFESGPE